MHKIPKKKLFFSLFFTFTVLFLLTSCSKVQHPSHHLTPMEPPKENFVSMSIINPDSEIRGVWIASVFNIDYPSSSDLTAAQLQAELDSILLTCTKNKLNTIFFQVRPACDALYESQIFPVSRYLSTDGTLPFDPLDYLVKKAHAVNIYVHAWINPLRVTVSGTDPSALPDGNPAKANPDWVVPYADGKLYFNAGLAEVRQLVADGVREIVENYDVDGVVFDDYFYPYPVRDEAGMIAEFDDAEEFAFYGSMFDNIADWRRDNINQIIRLCYNTVHEADPECVFGVAPTGIWQNNNGSNGGSNTTNGFEAYNALYCDALAWIEEGTIDYISPQIYWDFGHTDTPFDTVLRWWNAALDGSDIKLYVSHASYRYEDGEWDSPAGQLTEQVEYARSERSYRGSIFYGYDEIKRNINGASDDLIKAYQSEILYTDLASNGHGVTISSPANGTVLTSDSTYLIGMSDPYYPLTLNGQKIGRTKSGYFSLYVTLNQGENTFTFTQNGQEYTHTIHYKLDTADVPTETESITRLDSFALASVFPYYDIATTDKELWVSCVAPYGSWVTATLNGVDYDLVPLSEPQTKYVNNGYVGVTYGKLLSLPTPTDGTVLDTGKIVYRAYSDTTTAEAEGCRVRVMGKDAKIAVTVLNDYTHLKFTETSLYYNDYTVQSAGMTDFIVSQRNGFYRLRMGGYVSEQDVVETEDFPTELTEIGSVTVIQKDSETEIKVNCPDRPAYYGVVEDGRFVLTFYNINAATAPEPIIGKNPLFESCEVIRLPDSNRVRYSFLLFDERNFYGFDLRYEDGLSGSEKSTVVTLRNPKTLDLKAEKPLSGITMVLDAGHGGWDNGAAGALTGFAEKDINLAIVLEAEKKLTELGAAVILLRADDTYFDLYDRMYRLEELEPDLCISIHQNSMPYSTDITKVRGTLPLYCMDSGVLLAQCVGKSIADATNRLYRDASYQMLAMCRNPKFPAALIEVGFMTNVEEYEQMANGTGISKAAQGIVDGILRYYEIQAEFNK